MLSNPTHNSQPSPAQQWLTEAFANKWAEVIVKKPGEHWVSAQHPWKIERIARGVESETEIIGIRPEGTVRAVITDFDHKPAGGSVSPYWEASGRSRELIALQQEAERCGLQMTMLVSSDSGGLHGVLSLPQGIRAWLAHWVGVVLLERSGMQEAKGRAEVFPSEIQYNKTESKKDWARSNGVRLPGQKGCKLIASERFVENSQFIYEQLLCDLENTEICEAWEELLQEARQRARRNKFVFTSFKKSTKRSISIKWDASGQSQKNFAALTTFVRMKNPKVTCEYQLASLIKEAALNCEGFEEFASDETKKDLMRENAGIALRWARSSLRKSWSFDSCAKTVEVGGDKHHNKRLYKQSQAKLTKVWRTFKDASTWTKTKLAQVAGMSRRILEKHWEYWVQLAVPTPCNNGGHTAGEGEELDYGSQQRDGHLQRKNERFIFVDELGIFVDFLSRRSRDLQSPERRSTDDLQSQDDVCHFALNLLSVTSTPEIYFAH